MNLVKWSVRKRWRGIGGREEAGRVFGVGNWRV